VRRRFGALAAVLVLCGCGNSHAQRHEVADYVNAVNGIEVAMKAPLLDVARTNAKFSTKNIARTQRRATHSRVVLERLQKRLVALRAPAPATKLHARLIALIDGEVAMAREVEQLASFLPGLDRALAPVPAIQKRLNASLKGSKSRRAQAASLDAYAGALAGPIDALVALDPPPVSLPVRDSELRTLDRLQATARAIATALRRHRDARLPALERRFAVAATSSSSTAAQEARIAAVKAYNARVRRLSRLAVSVARERAYLAKTLP
jgi:hypothetical protein